MLQISMILFFYMISKIPLLTLLNSTGVSVVSLGRAFTSCMTGVSIKILWRLASSIIFPVPDHEHCTFQFSCWHSYSCVRCTVCRVNECDSSLIWSALQLKLRLCIPLTVALLKWSVDICSSKADVFPFCCFYDQLLYWALKIKVWKSFLDSGLSR